MRIVVTGSNGFIGSHVYESYQTLGYQVTGIDMLGGNGIKIDLTKWDVEQLTYFLRGVDVVNHHAAQVDVRKSLLDPSYDAEHNIQATLKLLDACVRAKVKRFIFASSGGAIADGNPSSPYGIAKLTVERYLEFYAKHHGLECVSLRYSNVYGPRQCSGVVPAMMKAAIKDIDFTVNGTGEQTRDFIFVTDVATANVAALTCLPNTYTIATGNSISLMRLKSLVNKIVPLRCIQGAAIDGEVLESSPNRAGPPEWNPTVSLEEGLRLTFEYYKTIY